MNDDNGNIGIITNKRKEEKMEQDRTIFFKNLGHWMKLSRERLSDKNSRCTQTKIGNHLGVTFQQIQKYENNTNDINLWNFIKLCEYFKEKPSDVINTCNADGYFNVKASVPMTNEEEYKNAGITEEQAKK